jgi:hypothetical protein
MVTIMNKVFCKSRSSTLKFAKEYIPKKKTADIKEVIL